MIVSARAIIASRFAMPMRAWRRMAGGAVPALLLLCACSDRAEHPLQGYVEGEYVRVAVPFAGTLERLTVKRGDTVAKGAPLFALEDDNETAARAQAQAQLAAAQARVENLKLGKRPPEVETVAEQLRQAQAARDLSAANLRRQQELFKAGFVSRAVIDDAATQLKRDEAQVASLAASVATAKLPARTQEIAAAHADAEAARQALAQSDWRLAQRAVAAPIAGLVHDTYYMPGDWVGAGSPVASLLAPGNVKLRFYVPEPALARVRPGARVQAACDGCGAALEATVTFVSDRAEFTPPVLYSKENRAKLVYLVEAKPSAQDATRLHVGQPIDVTLPGGP